MGNQANTLSPIASLERYGRRKSRDNSPTDVTLYSFCDNNAELLNNKASVLQFSAWSPDSERPNARESGNKTESLAKAIILADTRRNSAPWRYLPIETRQLFALPENARGEKVHFGGGIETGAEITTQQIAPDFQHARNCSVDRPLSRVSTERTRNRSADRPGSASDTH